VYWSQIAKLHNHICIYSKAIILPVLQWLIKHKAYHNIIHLNLKSHPSCYGSGSEAPMNQLHLARGELHGPVLLILGEDVGDHGHVCRVGAIAAAQHAEGELELSTIRATPTTARIPATSPYVHACSTFSSADTGGGGSGARSFASEPVALAQRRAADLWYWRRSVDVPDR
jgi:hypothetical protein